MKRFYHILLSAAVIAGFSSCSSDSDGDNEPTYKLINFENTGIKLAGPTSYGANLYANYQGQFKEANIPVTSSVSLHFGVNLSQWTGEIDFSGGGVALSQWNYRTDPQGETTGWWYTYLNQCSVYNTQSASGSNQGAGADGSDTFAVVYGQTDPYIKERTRINFTSGAELLIKSMAVCPTSFVYGCLTNGNPFGNDPDKTIQQAKGYFKILAYGVDAAGNPTNGGKPAEFYFCDYRGGNNTLVQLNSKWTVWDLSVLGKVNAIEFDFEGSDNSIYGLNTPSYAALDNILIEID